MFPYRKANLTVVLVWAALAALHLIATAHAQQPPGPACYPADVIVSGLKSDYGESPVFGGVISNGRRMMLFLNPEKGTWTLMTSPLPGMLCEAAEGEHGSIKWPAAAEEPGKDS